VQKSEVVAICATASLLVAATIPTYYIVRWAALLVLSGWLLISTITLLPRRRVVAKPEPTTPKSRLRVLSSVVESAIEGSEHSREILIREILELAKEAGASEKAIRDMEHLLRRSGRFEEALEECLDRIERMGGEGD